MIIFPENNPATRNSFSCGQSKQASSLYHTNYQVRMDKSGIILNSGQNPLVRSRYLKHINNSRISRTIETKKLIPTFISIKNLYILEENIQ